MTPAQELKALEALIAATARLAHEAEQRAGCPQRFIAEARQAIENAKAGAL